MQARITGTTMPVLEFVLEPNESIISEAGELSWMGGSIQMTTHTQFGGGGGLFGVLIGHRVKGLRVDSLAGGSLAPTGDGGGGHWSHFLKHSVCFHFRSLWGFPPIVQ